MLKRLPMKNLEMDSYNPRQVIIKNIRNNQREGKEKKKQEKKVTEKIDR
jgi:hypothetical protein